jgi:hypothetical protein
MWTARPSIAIRPSIQSASSRSQCRPLGRESTWDAFAVVVVDDAPGGQHEARYSLSIRHISIGARDDVTNARATHAEGVLEGKGQRATKEREKSENRYLTISNLGAKSIVRLTQGVAE